MVNKKSYIIAFSSLLVMICMCIIVVAFTTERNSEDSELTLDEVIELSSVKSGLSWDDFEQYDGIEVGSGLYILEYNIDENYSILVGGLPDESPMYIYLTYINGDEHEQIDIRNNYDNVKKFISDKNIDN